MARIATTLSAFLLALFLLVPAAQAQSYRAETIDNGNGFGGVETFATSTGDAATGYDAYATWSRDTLSFGYTGQDVGDGSCAPGNAAECPVYERGESASKHIVYYFDTDPVADADGTTQAKSFGTQSWTLPFRADYLVQIRTEGETNVDQETYTGEAALYEWSGGAWTEVAEGGAPGSGQPLIVGDNNGSKYLEFNLARSAVGSPDLLRTASWFVESASGSELSYAYWPENAVEGLPADGAATADGAALEHYYGFVLTEGQTPAASAGLANRDRPFFTEAATGPVNGNSPEGTAPSSAKPLHSLAFTNSNDFSGNEDFATSTDSSASTGYAAYATWDETNLYFGYTGSDVGGGDCADPTTETCNVYETGQSPQKYVVYYLDTDPVADAGGTRQAQGTTSQSWTLPFRADYAVFVRTDGATNDFGYTGVADVKRWDGSAWVSQGPDALEIFDNSSSGFLKFSINREALGSPDFVKVASWFYNEEDFASTAEDDRVSYGYWPAAALPSGADGPGVGTTRGDAALDSYYGFKLIGGEDPNASGGKANLNRPFFGGETAEAINGNTPEGEAGSSATPFHSIGFTTGNDFSGNEIFGTSTTAATGYDFYHTWDDTNLYFGLTGSDVGPGDCADPGAANCAFFETGQDTSKYVITYLDTDPVADQSGTTQAQSYGTQRWTLPFKADYAVLIRTDGETVEGAYTGVADIKQWDGSAWVSQGPTPLEVFDNSTSGFLKYAVAQNAIGAPENIKAVSFAFNTADDPSTPPDERRAYAYWPGTAPAEGQTDAQGTTGGATTLDEYYGFKLLDGEFPNASNGQANLNRTDFSPRQVNGNSPPGEAGSSARAFHTIGFTNSNDFNGNEDFATSTSATASTGYAAYATWDETNLYFGYTGSDVGGGDCADPTTESCNVYETGQSDQKHVVYYFDTDPTADAAGTRRADETLAASQDWTLPFKADYYVVIRTDGVTVEGEYTGVADIVKWDGSAWVSQGPRALEIFDNSSSGFLKFSINREALGSPDFVKVASWFYNEEDFDATPEDDRISYGYWPAAAPPADSGSPGEGTTAGDVALSSYYGFVLIDGQYPNASGGKANLNRDFFEGLQAGPVNGNNAEGNYPGTPRPFHSVGFTTSNDFADDEAFTETSTTAATGYDAYTTWDETNLYFGYTGQDVGDPACPDAAGPDCAFFETGQDTSKYVVTYLDTDPTGTGGTTDAEDFGGQDWTLPFQADYQLLLRTDGVTIEGEYTGVADLKKWDGSAWVSQGPDSLEIYDNSTSGFLKVAVSQQSVATPGGARPERVKVASWFFSEEEDASYAYWPAQAPNDADARGVTTAGSGPTVLDSYYGFELQDGQVPNASSALANLNREFFGPYVCASDDFATGGDYEGTSQPFHSVTINGSNGFNTAKEAFQTSTDAQTGYTAYTTWDEQRLYLGYTGSNVGGGDCAGEGCPYSESGQAPDRWLVYYIDTDPQDDATGTNTAYADALFPDSDTLGTDQTWTLPFKADYAILVRTDGFGFTTGYTGVAEVKRWNGAAWVSQGPCPLNIFDNNTSGYLEFAVDRSDIGNPTQVKMASWFFGPDNSYAYWPNDAASDGPASGQALSSWWGFNLENGVVPNDESNRNRAFTGDAEGDDVTYTTYTLDGANGEGEQLARQSLGKESPESATGPSNPELYLTWDADNLYLSLDGGALAGGNSDLYVALDTDPVLSGDPVTGNGLTTQPNNPTGNNYQPTYGFAADAVYQFTATNYQGNATEDATAQNPAPGRKFTAGSGAWNEAAIANGVRIIRKADGAPTEVAIPWSDLEGVSPADTSYIHAAFYLLDHGNGIDAQWPARNPNGSTPALNAFRSYYVRPGAETSSDAYLSVRETGGTTFAGALYGNLYLTPGGSAQTSTLGQNTTVVNELFIGAEATLNAGDNRSNPQGANRLRVGRRLTGVGTFEANGGEVLTFDPETGYEEEFQPQAAYATRSFVTKLVCDLRFDELTLRNETSVLACPDGTSGAATAVQLAAVQEETAAATQAQPATASTIDVDGALDLGGQRFTTGGNELRLGPSASVSGGGSTGGSGYLDQTTRRLNDTQSMQTVTDARTFTFDVGAGGSATPATIIVTGGQIAPDAQLTVDVTDETLPALAARNPASYLSRYFTVEQTGLSDFAVDVRLSYADDDVNGEEAQIVLAKFDGSGGDPQRFAPADPDANTLSGSGITSFSDFTGAEAQVIPVEMTSFEAQQREDRMVIRWSTATETNNDRFEVQRRVSGAGAPGGRRGGGENWATLGAQRGAGTTTEAQQYRFVDEDVPYEAEALTYRLVQYDADGDRELSEERTVEVAPPQAFTLHGNFPNPFTGRTTIRYELPEPTHVRIAVYDALGRAVRTLVDEKQGTGRKQAPFRAEGLSSGVYFYRITAGSGYTETRRMVLVR